MNTFRNRTVFVFALAALAAATHAGPASAMGRSGAPAPMADSRAQVTERLGQMETQMHSQIETLRKELAELKAQQALAKGTAAAE